MEKKLVFLLYDSRSGSTLFSALLNRYKGISVSQESTFIHRIIEFRDTPTAEGIQDLFKALSKEVQFTELNFNTEEFIDEIQDDQKGPIPKKKLIELMLQNYFQRRDPEAAIRIIKQGDYLYMNDLIEMFPDSAFLQIVRDGRAVFNSKKQTYSFEGALQDTNPLHAAWNWVQKLKKAEYYSDKVLTIRYEDLLKDSEKTLHAVLDKLNIPQNLREKTKKQEDYFLDLGKRQKPLHQHVKERPQEDFIDKWKKDLSKKEIMVYTWWSEKYLEKYVYEIPEIYRPQVYVYSSQYLILYLFNKAINAIKLLRNPARLRLKLKRKLRMMVRH